MEMIHPQVASASEKRRELRDAMKDLEAAASRPSSSEGWADRVDAALGVFVTALHAHIDDVEGPQGLLAQIIQEAPRLSADCDTFKTDHVEFLQECDRLKEAIDGTETGGAPDAAAIRNQVNSLIHDLVEHRSRGSDLVFDAYNVDIAAGD